MAADITSGASFQAGTPKALFKVTSPVVPNGDVSSDGQLFLILRLSEQGSRTPFTVLLNWESLLRK